MIGRTNSDLNSVVLFHLGCQISQPEKSIARKSHISKVGCGCPLGWTTLIADLLEPDQRKVKICLGFPGY